MTSLLQCPGRRADACNQRHGLRKKYRVGRICRSLDVTTAAASNLLSGLTGPENRLFLTPISVFVRQLTYRLDGAARFIFVFHLPTQSAPTAVFAGNSQILKCNGAAAAGFSLHDRPAGCFPSDMLNENGIGVLTNAGLMRVISARDCLRIATTVDSGQLSKQEERLLVTCAGECKFQTVQTFFKCHKTNGRRFAEGCDVVPLKRTFGKFLKMGRPDGCVSRRLVLKRLHHGWARWKSSCCDWCWSCFSNWHRL